MIIQSDSTINSGLQGLLSALGKPKSNPVQQVSFYSDESKQKWHHFRTWWKMKINNLSFITTLRLQSVTLELGSIERITLTCGLQPPFPGPFQYWPQTWDNSTEKTILKKYCERERQVSEQCDPSWVSLIVASHTDVLWQFQNETVFSICTS